MPLGAIAKYSIFSNIIDRYSTSKLFLFIGPHAATYFTMNQLIDVGDKGPEEPGIPGLCSSSTTAIPTSSVQSWLQQLPDEWEAADLFKFETRRQDITRNNHKSPHTAKYVPYRLRKIGRGRTTQRRPQQSQEAISSFIHRTQYTTQHRAFKILPSNSTPPGRKRHIFGDLQNKPSENNLSTPQRESPLNHKHRFDAIVDLTNISKGHGSGMEVVLDLNQEVDAESTPGSNGSTPLENTFFHQQAPPLSTPSATLVLPSRSSSSNISNGLRAKRWSSETPRSENPIKMSGFQMPNLPILLKESTLSDFPPPT
ncbi:hypothetical protein BP6252_01848 [Coleophoma cylindrospora]|uniref:Uncharacterized protein n=1 Tax=Coleophoma cylindrospora TaxID=1849047 RepID=A0A3D8SES3_9HELO|nr:hypothetical protein BP6252_01848 [Coleophoma cylindrospora]